MDYESDLIIQNHSWIYAGGTSSLWGDVDLCHSLMCGSRPATAVIGLLYYICVISLCCGTNTDQYAHLFDSLSLHYNDCQMAANVWRMSFHKHHFGHVWVQWEREEQQGPIISKFCISLKLREYIRTEMFRCMNPCVCLSVCACRWYIPFDLESRATARSTSTVSEL